MSNEEVFNTNHETIKNKPTFANYLFNFVYALAIITTIFALVGLFGEIFKQIVFNPSFSWLPASQATYYNVDYFFGGAIKEIQEAMQNYRDSPYPSALIVLLVFEYIFWLLAIVGTLITLGRLMFDLYQYNKEQKPLKYQHLLILLLFNVPHLLLFSFRCTGNLSIFFSNYMNDYKDHFTITAELGWGLKMIIICDLIALFLALFINYLNKLIAQKDDKSVKLIVGDSLYTLLVFASFFIICLSLGKIVRLDLSGELVLNSSYGSGRYNVVMNIEGTTIGDYLSLLQKYSANSLPNYSIQLLLGPILIMIGLYAFLLFIYFAESHNLKLLLSLFLIYFSCLIAGYILGFYGEVLTIKDQTLIAGTSIKNLADGLRLSDYGLLTIVVVVVLPLFSIFSYYVLSPKTNEASA